MRASDITSFTEYRKRLREHHDEVRKTGRPLFITNNGEPDAVVMSPEAYDELMDRAELPEIIAAIKRAQADIAAGKGIELDEARRRLAEKYGLV